MNKFSYNEIVSRIKKLKELSQQNAEPSEFYQYFEPLMSQLPLGASSIKSEFLFRSRWNKKGELFESVEDLIYPKPNLVLRKGRLNNIGESILYASPSELGTIVESRPDLNKLFTISKIKILNKNLIYLATGNLNNSGKIYASRNNELVTDFIHSELTKNVENPEDYNSTIAMANFFFNKKVSNFSNVKYLNIIYPSVEASKISNQKMQNVAIKSEVFDNNYEIIQATVYCLINNETHYTLTDLNITENINKNGDLEWRYNFDQMIERISMGLSLNGIPVSNLIGIEKDLLKSI
ncbi:MAG: hypothetical protein RLO17_18745 [Cyclobacteriaceae bacterium]